MSLNELLALLPGEQPPAKRDREVTDGSVENDPQYAAFLDTWRARTATPSKAYRPRGIAAPLYGAVTRLQDLRLGGSKKAELEGAVDTFLDVGGRELHTQGSVGIDVSGREPGSVEELVKHADMAFYWAKAVGKNTCRFFTLEMDRQLQARRALERDLHEALQPGDLTLDDQSRLNALRPERYGSPVVICRALAGVRGDEAC